jgi:Zn-dependent M28 family amino/carboxypeptidase
MLRLLIFATLLAGCQSPPPPRETDGQAALAYAKAQLDFGPRIPGTPGHLKMAAWLDSVLRAKADSVVVQTWTHVSKTGESVELKNFIARFNPKATRRLLFFTHWDTRPIADNDSGARAKQPVPGANDGASGVAVQLAMADAFKKTPPTIGVDLLFVDGEDYGIFSEDVDVLLGSRYYAKHPSPGPGPEYAVLLDMVGGANAQFQKEGNSVTAAPAVVDLVWGTAARLGYASHFVNETGGSITDDHIPLQQAGIRAIDIIPQIAAGYPAWHTIDDTLDKLAAETLKAVGDVMVALVREAKRVE